jgi:hypothetical protein
MALAVQHVNGKGLAAEKLTVRTNLGCGSVDLRAVGGSQLGSAAEVQQEVDAWISRAGVPTPRSHDVCTAALPVRHACECLCFDFNARRRSMEASEVLQVRKCQIIPFYGLLMQMLCTPHVR